MGRAASPFAAAVPSDVQSDGVRPKRATRTPAHATSDRCMFQPDPLRQALSARPRAQARSGVRALPFSKATIGRTPSPRPIFSKATMGRAASPFAAAVPSDVQSDRVRPKRATRTTPHADGDRCMFQSDPLRQATLFARRRQRGFRSQIAPSLSVGQEGNHVEVVVGVAAVAAPQPEEDRPIAGGGPDRDDGA